MEKRNDDIAQSAREAAEASRIFDPTLEALRVQRHACLASGEETVAIYDKLRDELVLARQRFGLRATMELPHGRHGETLVQPPNPADTTGPSSATLSQPPRPSEQSGG
jgi:hypothetical protein